MSVEVVTTTFEQVVENQEPEIACECHWHTPARGAAEWVIVILPLSCCEGPDPRTRLWCNDCLQEVLAWHGLGLRCQFCGHDHPGLLPRDLLISYEPIRRAA